MKITHFLLSARNMVSFHIFFFYVESRGTNKNGENGREGDLMSMHRRDNMDKSLYFLSITLKLFSSNILSDKLFWQSALSVCRRGEVVSSPWVAAFLEIFAHMAMV